MKLKSVDLLMRRHPLAPDVEKSVVGFLGPPRSLPLSEACRYGSIHLLDWIWGSTDDPNSKWFLATSLRSNVHYHQWQFTKSLEVAAARGDLDIVKWLFEHFEGCEALSSVADAAAKNGNLSVLQFLLPFKVRDGDWRFANTLCGGKNVVHWGDNVLLKAAENGQVEVAKWLLDKEENALDDLTRTITIEQALIASDFEFVDRLLPTDGRKCVLSYDLLSPGSEMIEWMLDTGYFKWDEHVAGSAIRDLAGSGHLELMQQIMQLHSPLREATENWFAYWGDALETACSSGQLKVVQWLIEHPLGRKRRLYLNATIYIDDLLCAAAGAGRVQVMRYLFEHGVGDKYGNGILRAARNGHSEAVKWLLKHFCYDEQVEMDRVVREAMTYGHAETLQVFQELESSVALEPLNDNKQKDCAAMDWWGRVGDLLQFSTENT
ncbi:DNA excision repair protein ERCC-6 [Phytophthora pseudosyringae]|uniref:DNA excision repair protein ERCC-6 n=1 Tax=Phytophthora pseudosyringae TaxID=221518 RepID=A0A8T1VBQ6_9STRA|nr:DNA excision repair protein ERCC-6 [Phytophthora pseudosyringae]